MSQETFRIFDRNSNSYAFDTNVSICILFDHSLVFQKSQAFHDLKNTKGIAINFKSYRNFERFLDDSIFLIDKHLLTNYFIWSNIAYSDSVQLIQDSLNTYLLDNNKDLEKLYSIFNEIDSGNRVKSISLTLENNPRDKKLTSSFLIEDIVGLLRKSWAANKEQYLHSNQSTKRDIFVRWLIINELYHYLKPQISSQKGRSQNAALDFIMYFLYYAQIPTSASNYDITMLNRSPIQKNLFENTKFPPYESLRF